MRTDYLGGGLMALALVLLPFVLRRRAVERRFTLYSSAGRWEDALPAARALASFWAPALVRGRRRMNLGKILARLGKRDEARAALEAALATQLRARDPYASLTRLALAELELHAKHAEAAEAHARAVLAEGSDEVKPRAHALVALAKLVGGDAAAALALLEPREDELRASKRPGDALALAVLAAALAARGSSGRAGPLAELARARIPQGQREEIALQAPVLAPFLAP